MNPNLEGATFATTSGLLTGTGAETVYDTTVAITYAINGRAYVKATIADGVTPIVDGNTGVAFNPVYPDQACVLVWGLNAAGAVSLYQGEIVDVDGETDILKTACQFPNIPNTVCPFAYTLFQTAGTSSAGGIRPGTANWNATGLTATHRNLLAMPGRPVAA